MDLFYEILNFLSDGITLISTFLVSVLPDSPFKLLDTTPIRPYLSFINYFIPVDFIIDTLVAWLFAIAVYYSYSVILRFIKAVS